MNAKGQKLAVDLKKYKEKLAQMTKDWAATRGGSRYGDEYLETQIKVYQAMIAEIIKEMGTIAR